ncbi:TetR/AcrR family transcriptional regulator [uncultured Corynebacterium sp.]|uniref:TetR/AcrR family transcriptional regulator n=1 Tax=uncultured Corynebacterium sp. TaxID=159447 RepID=UPI0025ED34F2|nr:TetR/AcrR family transcriptional regulator [uncultured Corynebacterium sp.]
MMELSLAPMTPGAEKILEAASRLFYDQGIHATGVDAIAAEAGITKRTLYDRFGSKDSLVEAYLTRRHEHWWQRWMRRVEESPSHGALTVFDAYVEDAPLTDRGCAFLNAAGELGSNHVGMTVIRRHKRLVREKIESLLSAEGRVDAAELAEHIFLLLEGAVAHRGVDGEPTRLRQARRIAERLLENT